MSLATPRAAEVAVGRNAEKQHTIHKSVSAQHLRALAAVQPDGEEVRSRDPSPAKRSAGTATPRRPVSPSPPLNRELCPPSPEHRPTATKPPPSHRHEPQRQQQPQHQHQHDLHVQRRLSHLGGAAMQRGSSSSGGVGGVGEGGSGAAAAPRDLGVGAGADGVGCGEPVWSTRPAACLPSWNMARSELWLMVGATLLKMQPPHSQGPAAAAPGQLSGPEQLSPLPSFGAALTAMTAATSAADTAAPDAVTVACQGSSSPTGAMAGQRSAAKTPFACFSTQVSISRRAPGLSGLLRQASSLLLRRPWPPTPQGLGPLPSLLTPSFTLSALAAQHRTLPPPADRTGAAPVSTLEPSWEEFTVLEPPAWPPAAAAVEPALTPRSSAPAFTLSRSNDKSAGDHDHEHHHDHHPKHHAAFAAGVAVATSTAAAVSHAAAAAAAGLAGLMAQSSLGTAAGALLHLGGNVLSVGSSVAATKLQGPAMHKSTMTAAESVLGRDAPEAARRRLRQRLRHGLAGVSVAWFLLHLHTTTDLLAL